MSRHRIQPPPSKSLRSMMPSSLTSSTSGMSLSCRTCSSRPAPPSLCTRALGRRQRVSRQTTTAHTSAAWLQTRSPHHKPWSLARSLVNTSPLTACAALGVGRVVVGEARHAARVGRVQAQLEQLKKKRVGNHQLLAKLVDVDFVLV